MGVKEEGWINPVPSPDPRLLLREAECREGGPQVSVRTRKLIYNPGVRCFLEAVSTDSALRPGKGDHRLTVSGVSGDEDPLCPS